MKNKPRPTFTPNNHMTHTRVQSQPLKNNDKTSRKPKKPIFTSTSRDHEQLTVNEVKQSRNMRMQDDKTTSTHTDQVEKHALSRLLRPNRRCRFDGEKDRNSKNDKISITQL
jgi:hypothetical protein